MKFDLATNYIVNIIRGLDAYAEINLSQESYIYHYHILFKGQRAEFSFTRDQLEDFENSLSDDSAESDRRKGQEYFFKFKIYTFLGNAGLVSELRISEVLLSEKRDWLKRINHSLHLEQRLYDVFFKGLEKLSVFLKCILDTHGQYIPEVAEELKRVNELLGHYSKYDNFAAPGVSVETLGYLKAGAIAWILDREKDKEGTGIPKRAVKKIDEDIYYTVAQLREAPFFQIEMPEFIYEYADQLKRETNEHKPPYAYEKAALLNNWIPFAKNKKVFIAHRFQEKAMVGKIKDGINAIGFGYREGKVEDCGFITDDILNKIKECSFFLTLITPFKEFKDDKFSTSSWILMEIGAAIALERKALILADNRVEQEEYAKKLQPETQYEVFSEKDFEKKLDVVMSRIKKEWQKQNKEG